MMPDFNTPGLTSQSLMCGNSRQWHRWGEPLAAGLNLAYTIGYMNSAAWSFAVAAIGSALYIFICWQRHMIAETTLWLYYLAMAGYGMVVIEGAWPNPLPVASWKAHALSIIIGLGAWAIVYVGLKRYSNAWRPGLDAFTTVGSLVATYWMLQFVQANWLYWIVINAAGIALYSSRKMTWTTLLFVVYTALAIEGWFDFFAW